MFYADELNTSERKMRNLALISVKSRLVVSILSLKAQLGLNTGYSINVVLSVIMSKGKMMNVPNDEGLIALSNQIK